MKSLATEMAPPFILVAHYFIAAAIFFAAASFLLPFFSGHLEGFFISSTLASYLHLFLLGFVMMTIFGAMYQLIPVILEIPLFSKDFAYIQFYVFLAGIFLMVGGFYFEQHMAAILPFGALLAYLSMLIFIANVFLTYKELERWGIVAKLIFTSNIFLFIGVTIGFIVALNLSYGFLTFDVMALIKAHIAATVIGYVMMTIMGVAMILIPMFALSHGFSEKPITYAYYAVVAGLLVYFAGLFTTPLLEAAGGVLILVSILLFMYQMVGIFKGRVRKTHDFWSLNMVASFWFLAVVIVGGVAGLAIDKNSFKLFIGFAGFFGFFLFIIVGHIYKILPFLVWFQRYSPLVGKQKVPMLHEMVVPKIAEYQFWGSLWGFAIASAGIVLSLSYAFAAGALIMAVSSLLVIYNIYYTLTYKK